MLPEQLPKNNFPSKTSKNRCKQGDKQEQNPKQDYEKPFRKQGPKEQVSRQARFPSKFRRNRLPRNRFASKVFKNRCPGKVPRIVNGILQSLIFSSNGTERLKK